MRQITKYMKTMLVVAVGMIAIGVSSTGSAGSSPPAVDESGSFCNVLEPACEDDQGTTVTCLETPTHTAVCASPIGDEYDRKCARFDGCHIDTVLNLHICTCLL